MLITVLEGKTELSDKVKEEEVKTDVVQSIQIMQQKKGGCILPIYFHSSPLLLSNCWFPFQFDSTVVQFSN